jgi:arylsulfatase
MSVHQGEYKLVAYATYQASVDQFELYNLARDPLEKLNLITQERERAVEMKAQLDAWIKELHGHPNNSRNHYIKIGKSEENPVVLNRNDAKGPVAPWTQSELYGYWDIEIEEDGIYDLTFHFFEKMAEPGNMILKLNPYHYSVANPDPGTNMITLEKIGLPKGTYRLEPRYSSKSKSSVFPFYVEVEKNTDQRVP